MKTLIIYAHPNDKSYNASILETVKENLSSKHELKVLDLYKERFDPVLRFDTTHRRRDLAHDVAMKDYRDLIIWAILKGFIERVFVAGFAYENTPRGLDGNLTGKAWIITTHNTPKIILPLVQDYSRVLKSQILKPCGIKSVKVTQISPVEYMGDHKRKEVLKKITKIARRL